jgi:hypothetical protein
MKIRTGNLSQVIHAFSGGVTMNRHAGLQCNGFIDANRILNAREKTFFNRIFKKEVFALKPGHMNAAQKVQAAPRFLRKF